MPGEISILSESVAAEADLVQDCVSGLQQGLAGAAWGDEKYSELSRAVADLAKDSASVIRSADRCRAIMGRYESIVNESY